MGRMRNRCSKREGGFTLVEYMLSVFVAVLILGGAVVSLLYLTLMTSSSKKEALVAQDVQLVMERLSATPFTNLNTQFPNNQALSSNFVSNVLGGYKVSGESILVSYPNGTTANPREAVVIGSWPERGVSQTLSMRTMRRG